METKRLALPLNQGRIVAVAKILAVTLPSPLREKDLLAGLDQGGPDP